MKQKKLRVFITVKTYPTLSAKYDELVCTAGITEEGKWIRIYPVPFRKLEYDKQYKKYQWIEADLIRNKNDFRPESYSPINRGKSIVTKDLIKNWDGKWDILSKTKVYKNLETLISHAKDKKKSTSLAIFKPKEIVDFKCEKEKDSDWDPEKLRSIKDRGKQIDLFDSDKPHEIFKIVKKLPYKFSYTFTDEKDKKSTLMIEDWEIGALYWKCFKKYSEEVAVEKVKDKYLEIAKKDIHFFLGTTLKFHNIAPNPFIIIGLFYPPVQKQQRLF